MTRIRLCSKGFGRDRRHIIGTHWFQMVDNLPTGRPSDEERLNCGFINVIDLPYAELVDAARQTHRRIYGLKYGRLKPFAEKPRYKLTAETRGTERSEVAASEG